MPWIKGNISPFKTIGIDNIMKKLMNTDGFKWRNIADKILYIKDTRSKSYNSMKNYISRGEAVYMLNIINEEKY